MNTILYHLSVYILTYFVLVFIYDKWYGNELLTHFILWAFLGFVNLKIFQILIKKYKLKSVLYIFLIDVGILILGFLIASFYVVGLLPYMGFIILTSLLLFLLDFIKNEKIKIGIFFSLLIILFIPFIIKYPGFCEKNDWRCMSNRAILINNPSFCKHMINDGYFTMCISYTAGQTVNPILCDDYLTNNKNKFECYLEVINWARSRHGSVKEKGNEIDVIKNVCPKIEYISPIYTSCMNTLAQLTHYSVCETLRINLLNIKDLDILNKTDNCYAIYAQDNSYKNISTSLDSCNQIINESRKENCINQIKQRCKNDDVHYTMFPECKHKFNIVIPERN